jgi:acetolactate synthase-1/2/3 large subunit
MTQAGERDWLSPADAAEAIPAAFRQTALPANQGPTSERDVSVSEALVDVLVALGAEHVFGIIGGGIAPFCEAASRSPLRFIHCRHEGGAAFAAIEASLATGKLTVVVATTGPGLSNLLTGMLAARYEGAKVLFISGATAAAQRGRGAFQETSGNGAYAPFFATGALFHHAQLVEHPDELLPLASRLASGVARPNGFVAHVGLPLAVQTSRAPSLPRPGLGKLAPPAPDRASVAHAAELLKSAPFVIWAGFGARHAAPWLLDFAEASGARVLCSPRGKGVIPEDHPLFLGVAGLGGHPQVDEYLRERRPARALVLGSRLSEMTSFWSQDLLPPEGLVHVDLDESAFGAAYPNAPTLGIQAEIGAFLQELLPHFDYSPMKSAVIQIRPRPIRAELLPRSEGLVRPSYLMAAIQRHVVDGSDAVVLTEAGNAFMLGSHYLRFPRPGRYRSSTTFGSMGQAAGGVLGAALGRGKAVALVGDGSMLMLNEMNTAAQYGINAVWVVLNDSAYGMIAQGMRSLGWKPFEVDFPRADFVAIAGGMGVPGVRVESEQELGAALERAMNSRGPFVVDVQIDPNEKPPANRRNQSLVKQGVIKERAAG